MQEHWVDWPDAVYDKVGNILLVADHGRRRPAGSPPASTSAFAPSWEEALELGQAAGGKPYAIPAGASDHPLGGLGFARWAEEVQEQERELGVFFDTIVVCSVTGSTQAGMVAGFADASRERVACSESTARRRSQQTASRSRGSRGRPRARSALREPSRGGDHPARRLARRRYGIPDDKTLEAIRLCARLEGMLTDPSTRANRWPR